MRRLPGVMDGGRWIGLAIMVAIALGQAITLVVAAFSTRDIITVIRTGQSAAPVGPFLLLGASGVAMFALRSLEGALAEATGQHYAKAIRRKLFLHMSRTPLSVINERRAGALALRYVGDLNALKGWVSKGIARLISAGITIPAALFVLTMLDPRLALGAAGPIAITIVCFIWLGGPLGEAYESLRQRRAAMAASMAERLPQSLALRRAGRMSIELRGLADHSNAIAGAAIYRVWLSETLRALPDMASGIAGAICLWICILIGMSVENAVASLTALALVVWPLKRLADVKDRHKAYVVSARKLEATLAGPTVVVSKRKEPVVGAPALMIEGLRMKDSHDSVNLVLRHGEVIRLEGLTDVCRSTLLAIAAGLEREPCGIVKVLGQHPATAKSGSILYTGRFSPQLKGSLRRDCILGIGRIPSDDEIERACQIAGLSGLLDRIGGLSGQIAEGRRNVTVTDIRGILLVRGLLSKPNLALIDADEVGFDSARLQMIVDHMTEIKAAIVLVSADPIAKTLVPNAIQLSALSRSPGVDSAA